MVKKRGAEEDRLSTYYKEKTPHTSVSPRTQPSSPRGIQAAASGLLLLLLLSKPVDVEPLRPLLLPVCERR